MTEFNSNLQKLLILHEGKVNKPYVDTFGKITIGVGRNLTDRGVSDSETALMLSNDTDLVIKQFKNNFPFWDTLSEVRKLVVMDMIFNVGINRFLGFKKMIDAIHGKDFLLDSKEMLDSTWAKQVGGRSLRLSEMMKSDKLPIL
jgi:lysozyme